MIWSIAEAPAKINLALVVGPTLSSGKHEVATLLVPLELADTIRLRPAPATTVTGFPDDTIVGGVLAALAAAAGHDRGWEVVIEKRIPIAAGLGGGSTDAASALRLANATLRTPLPLDGLHAIAAAAGADVPFFLEPGPKLGSGDGSVLEAVAVPLEISVLLALPDGIVKQSTGAVYRSFDERAGEVGFAARRARLLALLDEVRTPADFAALPPNDLASSPLAVELSARGALRSDVSGAGPTVYALFKSAAAATSAAAALEGRARTWITRPRTV